jgi:hypothetical protein
MAVDKLRQLGAARAVEGLRTTPQEPNPLDQIANQQLQDAELPHTSQEESATILPARLDEDQIYDTKVDDRDLDLSSTHISGSKEALEDRPEDEGHSKRAKTAPLHPSRNK